MTSWSMISFWTRAQHCKVNCFDFVLREVEPARCRLPVYCMTLRVPHALFVVSFEGSFIMTVLVSAQVDLYNAGPDSGSAISGIFIKNVLPQSPAGRTGELKVCWKWASLLCLLRWYHDAAHWLRVNWFSRLGTEYWKWMALISGKQAMNGPWKWYVGHAILCASWCNPSFSGWVSSNYLSACVFVSLLYCQ